MPVTISCGSGQETFAKNVAVYYKQLLGTWMGNPTLQSVVWYHICFAVWHVQLLFNTSNRVLRTISSDPLILSYTPISMLLLIIPNIIILDSYF